MRAMTAEKEQVYVTIVLTDLNSESGWFIFLEGSHRRKLTAIFLAAE